MFVKSENERLTFQFEQINQELNQIIASGRYQVLPCTSQAASGSTAASPGSSASGWSAVIIVLILGVALSALKKHLISNK